jgi:hypothetical protein
MLTLRALLNDIIEMRSWPSFLSFQGTTDGIFRAVAVILAGVIIVRYSTLFEEEYTKKLTALYIHPWWRILVVLLLISSAIWCPRVGILVALLVFFYLSDMNTLITPFSEI